MSMQGADKDLFGAVAGHRVHQILTHPGQLTAAVGISIGIAALRHLVHQVRVHPDQLDPGRLQPGHLLSLQLQ